MATKLVLDSIKAGEESLLFDVFLAAAAMDTENDERDGSPEGIEGPFYFPGAPVLSAPFKLTQRPDEDGELLFFKGVVTSASGEPLKNAELDIWQADSEGQYSKINPSLPEWNLRGRIATDDRGAFEVQSILPPPYEIPKDGPTGKVLELLGRHCFRPAHLHVKVRSGGYRELTSQLYFEGGDYLDSDVAKAVRDNLVAKLVRYQGKNAVERRGLDRPFVELTYNFALEPA
ncbi:MAG: catechol 1,2-dioxygenase [Rhizobiaceae bacterium]